MKQMTIKEKLIEGNRNFLATSDQNLREQAAVNGQHPYAIVICCSDSRVIPEQIFSASVGELFVIRVAGNVLDKHQLGSIEYAAAHLECKLILLLGHTGCGAIAAALSGHVDGFISYITDDIQEAIGEERDPDRACRLNVRHGVERIRKEFDQHPEMPDVEIRGAVYDIQSGEVEWLL
jgi:carbonic anhydrase